MTKAQQGPYAPFDLEEYVSNDDADVEDRLPYTTRPPAFYGRSPGAPSVTFAQRDITFPAVPTGSSLERLTAELDRWGHQATRWAESTFPKKLDGVTGGKIRSRAAEDGTIVVATGLARHPDSVVVHPREPINFIRAYVLPEEERHTAAAAKGLVLAPGDIVVKCLLFDSQGGIA